tara:strand:+ start:6681 stop:6788 length:108 start_codon:yes stop_codon:yes gene_type:complete
MKSGRKETEGAYFSIQHIRIQIGGLGAQKPQIKIV